DPLVTGVQTCALPIFDRAVANLIILARAESQRRAVCSNRVAGLHDIVERVVEARPNAIERDICAKVSDNVVSDLLFIAKAIDARSEERRVGDGWRAWV